MEDARVLRAKANLARRLAEGVGTADDRLSLMELAATLDAEAEALEADASTAELLGRPHNKGL
jgi:hypothetical protein